MTNINTITFDASQEYVVIKILQSNEVRFVEDFVAPNYVCFTKDSHLAKHIDKNLFFDHNFRKTIAQKNLFLALIDNDFSLTWDKDALMYGYLYNDIYQVNPSNVSFNKRTVIDYLQKQSSGISFLEEMQEYNENEKLFKLKKIGE